MRCKDKPRIATAKRPIIVQVYKTLRKRIGSSTALKSSVPIFNMTWQKRGTMEEKANDIGVLRGKQSTDS